MEKLNKNKTGIEAILDKLFKSRENNPIEDEIEEQPFISEEEEEDFNEELDKSEDEELEDEELEKSDEEEFEELDDEEEIDDELDEDYEEDDEAELELDYEELVGRVSEDVMNAVDSRLEELEDLINGILNNQGQQTEAISESYEKSQRTINNLRKSLSETNKKLEKVQTMRKSVKNVNVNEKFKTKSNVDELSKSQKASMLADLLESGNRQVLPTDVTNAELGKPISEQARAALENATR